MAKFTYLADLNAASFSELQVRQRRCQSVYKNLPTERWLVVCEAHNRRVIRKARRSVGKSNKLRCRRTPKGICAFLNELNMWAQIRRATGEGK